MSTTREIRRLLVANRGEIALRVMRTASAMGIETVAVHSDVDAGEPFVLAADVAVSLGGTAAAENYLVIDKIIQAATATGADAIHPGYGFLAENAEFARRCEAAGIIFVGPSPDAIERMGSKLAAKRLLVGAGVPVLQDVDATGMQGEELVAAGAKVGYPLLIKPAAGGGGKGMTVVREPAALEAAVASSRRLAADAFGDDTILLERYVENGRHIEIQILGDQHGTVTYLGERECSIQRRHQKILEESPSVAVDEELRARMGAAAVAAGETIDYVGAGTVEFLLGDDGAFFFLEVNTRLQVEHPVTEMVTGLDLVRLQLEVAMGAPIPDEAKAPTPVGHAIEVRLYAEDPAEQFLPQTGRLDHLDLQASDVIRVDSGAVSGSEISIYYDPMIAKIIAHAPTRREATRALVRALRRSEVDGLRTNRDFLVRLLEDDRFAAGAFSTTFLDDPSTDGLRAPLVEGEDLELAALAAALAAQAARRRSATVQTAAPTGFRSHPWMDQWVEYTHGERTLKVEYLFVRGEAVRLLVDGRELEHVRVLSAQPGAVVLEVSGVAHRFTVRLHGDRAHVNTDVGQCDFVELPRYPDLAALAPPGSLMAPMPGKVVRIAVEIGDEVVASQPLLTLEAMKMEHEIIAPEAGVIAHLPVAVGTQVDLGTVLVAIQDGDGGDAAQDGDGAAPAQLVAAEEA
jgi:acetyl/propionyl-CoA carboxylase alpha subunit